MPKAPYNLSPIEVDATMGVRLIRMVPDLTGKIAKRLRISTAAVYMWTEIPVSRVFDVEEVTGLPRELLRPDLFLWPRNAA